MTRFLLKIILFYFISKILVRYRYNLLNRLFSIPFLRSMVVSSSMNMPFIRQTVLQGMFKN